MLLEDSGTTAVQLALMAHTLPQLDVGEIQNGKSEKIPELR